MHRTTGDSYGVDSGKNIFRSENPGVYEATQFTHDTANALQEEICNVITGAGATLNSAAESISQMNQLNAAIDTKIDAHIHSEASGQPAKVNPYLHVAGVTEGAFVSAVTGFDGSVSCSVRWRLEEALEIGTPDIVRLTFSNISGTSDDIMFRLVEKLPVELRPRQRVHVPITVLIGTNVFIGAMLIYERGLAGEGEVNFNSGDILGTNLYVDNTLNWLNTGIKGIPAQTVYYPIWP